MKNYYVLSNGRVRRESNTLYIEKSDGEKKPVPVEDVESLYLYGEVDLNTKLLNFLSQKRIPLHVFNYYGFYAGSYYPREYLHSGYLLVHQVSHYSDGDRRLALVRELIHASAHSLLKVLAYYDQRRDKRTGDAGPGEETWVDGPLPSHGVTDPATESAVDAALADPLLADAVLASAVLAETARAEDRFASEAESIPPRSDVGAIGGEGPPTPEVVFDAAVGPLSDLRAILSALDAQVDGQAEINALRGIEGKMRERYYHGWRHIVGGEWAFERRVRRPPDNEINALISFGNSILYTVCLSEIYRTQLTPTISYLHEPGARRFSLALDLSEVFKPLLVDRTIFKLLNTGQLQAKHFDRSLGSCFLNDEGKRLFLGAWEERLATTIRHRKLGRHVSYRHLIRLECYKLIRHLTGVETYRAFRAWW